MLSPTRAPTVTTFSRALLLGGIERQFNQKAKTGIARVLQSFDAKSKGIDADLRRYQKLKTEIGGALTTLDDTLKRLNQIRDALDAMSKAAIEAGRDSDGEVPVDGYRSVFDNQIDAIQSAATNSIFDPNLLADSGGFSLSFRTSLAGASYNVANAFMGTSYQLVEADGDVWVPDHRADLLARRAGGSDEADSSGYTTAGAVRLDALAGSTVTVTLGAGTAEPQTITASLEARGLGVKEGWYYNGLADDEGRDRAIADIDAARLSLDLEIGRYQVARSVTARYQSRADSAMKELRTERIGLVRERELESNRIQRQTQQELNSVSQALSFGETVNRAYLNLFNQYSVKPGSFGRVVGRTPAARLFSALLNVRA